MIGDGVGGDKFLRLLTFDLTQMTVLNNNILL